jgi:aminoglycoside 2'-N-acetyltransferase I
MSAEASVRQATTDELTARELREIRGLMDRTFPAEHEDGGFTDEDWQHTIGGTHFLLHADGALACHAAVVERVLHVGGVPLRCGYVEAVATEPRFQRQGHGTTVMRAVAEHIAHGFELGALATGSREFYQRLGWQVWQGPTSVRGPEGDIPTPDEDGYILVMLTPSTPQLDPLAPISCEWRPGDSW